MPAGPLTNGRFRVKSLRTSLLRVFTAGGAGCTVCTEHLVTRCQHTACRFYIGHETAECTDVPQHHSIQTSLTYPVTMQSVKAHHSASTRQRRPNSETGAQRKLISRLQCTLACACSRLRYPNALHASTSAFALAHATTFRSEDLARACLLADGSLH